MRILMMGGTRFIGVYLTQLLVKQGHEVFLFNRGNKPLPAPDVQQIQGDRSNTAEMQEKLTGKDFDVIFDNNGRELSDTQPLADLFKGRVQHFVYMSSAGVYLKSDQMPHLEGDPVDPKSRHKGKHDTEVFLAEQGLPFTSIRPTYIYGPKNYNDLEAWFFDRIIRNRPIPIPGHGDHITQLGHVQDLATAMIQVLGNTQAIGHIYNVSGDRFVTLNGLARACAIAAGKAPETVKIVNYNPKQFDFGKRKAFPLRPNHFFASIQKAKQDLGWQPGYDLITGLQDAFQNDYLASGREKIEPDFSVDDEILATI
ncbi:MAG: NAD-dependent epimerase/dehydratase family protein [Leptolyngbyaceae cyanobacterium]